jgi:hypothetical protein
MTREGFKRKLTSIFSAGAVGYSRLMGDDEAATVRTLKLYRNAGQGGRPLKGLSREKTPPRSKKFSF